MKSGRLVYSTDPQLNQKCPRCRELLSECTCLPEVDARSVRYSPTLRIEKQGRGGKTVTLIDRLPPDESFLKELTTALKKKCGAGGTFKRTPTNGVVEIQGDRREQVRAHFEQLGIRCKG